jgi:hypothetical protein
MLPDGVYLHEIPVYNFVTQRFDKVATTEVVSPVWDPTDSNRIAAYLKAKNGERSIILTDKQFSRVIRLFNLEALPDVVVRWLPDASALLLRGSGSTADTQKLWLLKLSNSELTALSPTGVTDALPSPNGQHILYQTGEGETALRYLLSVSDGSVRQLAGSGSIAKLAWRDSDSFFEPSSSGNSLTLTSTSGKQTSLPLTTPPAQSITAVCYLAAAKRIVFATSTGLYTVNAP